MKNSNHICKEIYLDSIIEGSRTGAGMNGWFREGRLRQEDHWGECQSFRWAQLTARNWEETWMTFYIRIHKPSWSFWASPVAQMVKNPRAVQETWVWSLGREDPLEKGKTTHSSILAWENPGGLQSTGWQRVRQNWATEHRRNSGFKEYHHCHA